LYVNGFIQEQDFLATNSLTVCDVFGETTCSFTVLEGEYFVLGDNRENSEDSRIFGTIDYDQIEGKVVYQFQTVLD
jgi:signal peptidase I